MPVEVTNLTFELHLPVDSQYSLPVEALYNLIVKYKSLPVEVSNSTIEAPSTRIRIFSNPQLFRSGYGYRPHVSGEFDSECGKK